MVGALELSRVRCRLVGFGRVAFKVTCLPVKPGRVREYLGGMHYQYTPLYPESVSEPGGSTIPGHPKPPGFIVYQQFRLRVDSLDSYHVYSALLCIGLSYLARVLVFYTILTLGSLLWPRLLTLTIQYHLGSIS